MKPTHLPWSNPYKTKLWFESQDGELGNYELKQLFYHVLGCGPRGCGDTNAQLSPVIHRGRTTVKKYIRILKNHHLFDVTPGWSQLAGGQFVKSLRYRRIIALPWPNKAAWMTASIQKSLGGVGQKSDHYQRRLIKNEINQQRDALLFGSPGQQQKLETAEGGKSLKPGGCAPETPPIIQGGDEKLHKLVRKGAISKYLKAGWSREHAIRLGTIEAEKILRSHKTRFSAQLDEPGVGNK